MTLEEALKITGLNKRQLCLRLGVEASNATVWRLRGKVPDKHVERILALQKPTEAAQ